MSVQNIYLCSFGDTRLGISICRFKQQAEALGVFNDIMIYTEASLPLNFKKYFKDKMYATQYKLEGKENIQGKRFVVTRGFGYWCWKPKVILMALEQIQENDILLYLDIGFEFNPDKKDVFFEMVKEVNKNEIMGYETKGCPEKEWNKMDLLVHYDLDKDENFLNKSQLAAGFVFMKKTKKTIAFIQEWLDVFYNHWNLIDDSPSVIPNLKCFKENRHDQSIWNVIAYKNHFKNFSFEYYYDRKNKPFLYNRNKLYLSQDLAKNIQFNNMLREGSAYSTPLEYYLNRINTERNNQNTTVQILTKQNLELQTQNFKFKSELNSLPTKKAKLEVLNLEQDLINKKLQSKKLAKDIGVKLDVLMPKITFINPNSAKARIHNHLAYKLGSALIRNSKSFLGYIKIPYVLFAITLAHKEQNANSKLIKIPSLESYPDYKEALKEKECFTYKLGEALMKAHKNWYGGGVYQIYTQRCA